MKKSNEEIIQKVKSFIMIDIVDDKYKSRTSDFTRNRKLPFTLLVLLMLRKLYKSLALEISDFFKELQMSKCFLTKSAFTQARQKLSPLFFQDLLQAFNHEFYTDNQARIKELKSRRILAIDGSTIDLPYSQELAQLYGIRKSNQYDIQHQIQARISVMHDLLNGMILDGVLQPCEQGEPTAALKHLQYCQPGDLIVYDRCYASFNMVYLHQQKHLHVLMRMRADFSHQIRSFAQSPIRDTIIMMQPPKNSSVKNKAYQEHEQLQVRLIKYTLDNGEQAILLTTLLDQQQYCFEFLKQIYAKRWGVETRYDVLKNVLQLEYFSGLTKQAILQDFYISLFLMNIQVLLAEELQQEVKQKYAHRKYQYQVNVALAIGHLKKSVVRLFLCKHVDEILAELKESFLQHVEPVRPGRKFPRRKDKYRTRKKPILMKNRKNVL